MIIKNSALLNVAGSQMTIHETRLLKIDTKLATGAAANLFLQLHNSATLPAEGAVPVKWWLATATQSQEFVVGELQFSAGLYVCLSSTGATKTIATATNDKFAALSVELLDQPLVPTEVVADSGSFSVAIGMTIEVIRVNVANLENAARYLQLFNTTGAADDSVPNAIWPLTALGTLSLDFGRSGVFALENVAPRTAITFFLSDTAATLTTATGNGMDLTYYHL
jgi:hypothetical protein